MIDRSVFWYKVSDGWFTYFVNKKTGERKLELEYGDFEIERNVDDFVREVKGKELY